MSKLLVFGATGRTGRHVVRLAHAASLRPIAAVRDLRAGATLVGNPRFIGVDMLKPESVEAAFSDALPDVAICAAGGRGNIDVDGDGVIAVIDACRRANVKRLIIVTSLGCGDSGQYASPALVKAIGPVLAAKTRAEQHVAATDLDWTIVRPGGLLDQPASGMGVLYDDPRVHGRVTCEDLAVLLIHLIDQSASYRRVLSAVDSATVSGPDAPRLFVVTDEHFRLSNMSRVKEGVA